MEQEVTVEQSCSSNTALIAVLCVALLVMTTQSIILGLVYHRWKKPRPNRTVPNQSIRNSVRRHRSNRSLTSANTRPDNTNPPLDDAPEYAVVNRNRNESSPSTSNPIYLNQSTKLKVTRNKSNVAQKPSLAINNELYTDMDTLKQESVRRGLSPGSQSLDMGVDNDTYFDSGSIDKRPVIPMKPKK